MVSGILLFFACRSLLKIDSLSQLGLSPRTRAASDIAIGLCLALGSMFALGFIMSVAGVYEVFFRLSLGESVELYLKAILTGLTVGFLEEIFFRGIIFRGLLEDWKPLPAFLTANLFYSALHFVKPARQIFSVGTRSLGRFPSLVFHFRAVSRTRRDRPGNDRSLADRDRAQLCLSSHRHPVSFDRSPCRLDHQH